MVFPSICGELRSKYRAPPSSQVMQSVMVQPSIRIGACVPEMPRAGRPVHRQIADSRIVPTHKGRNHSFSAASGIPGIGGPDDGSGGARLRGEHDAFVHEDDVFDVGSRRQQHGVIVAAAVMAAWTVAYCTGTSRVTGV